MLTHILQIQGNLNRKESNCQGIKRKSYHYLQPKGNSIQQCRKGFRSILDKQMNVSPLDATANLNIIPKCISRMYLLK